MSALPPAFIRAAEVDVLASLVRLLAAGKITTSQVRDLIVAYRVARSEVSEVEYYASYEQTTRWRRAA